MSSPRAELGARSEEDDRDPRRAGVLEQLLGDVPPVEAGHHHVEQDHVRAFAARLLHAGRPVGSLDHIHLLRLEVHTAKKADRRFVVDHENLGHPGLGGVYTH